MSNVSFYVASGDDGVGRLPRGQPGREVPRDRRPVGPAARDGRRRDEPSDAPFGGRVEKAWKGSGGGISINWPKPGYQRGGRTPNVPGGFCSSGTAQCRVTPGHRHGRRAADGVRHLEPRARRRLGAVWNIVGGTSAAAPLMAANHRGCERIRRRCESRLREPVHLPGSRHGDFHDITQGNNSNGTGSSFQAGPRFDMVTGRGSVIANNFATAFAGFTPPVLSFDTTKLTATHPTNMKRVKKGAVVTFEGVLTNVTGAHPIANRQIIVIGNGGIIGVDRTGTSGKWEIRFKVKKRTSWHAVFMGSASEKPDLSPTLTVRIQH